MVFVAYCPLGRGRLFNDPVLGEIDSVAAQKEFDRLSGERHFGPGHLA